MRVTYREGPLGVGVLLDGRIAGLIRKTTRDGWLVAVTGFKPGDGLPRGAHLFPSLELAKLMCETALARIPYDPAGDAGMDNLP